MDWTLNIQDNRYHLRFTETQLQFQMVNTALTNKRQKVPSIIIDSVGRTCCLNSSRNNSV